MNQLNKGVFIGEYLIGQKIGQGSFGSIYEASKNN